MSNAEPTDTTWRGLPIEYRPQYPGAANGQRPRKASEEVARRIVDDLMQRGYRVGDRFPAESDMLEEYGVSRESLREGLRLLEVQGLLTIRRGPGGGPFVSAVNAAFLAQNVSLFFHVAGATYRESFEAWALLEPAMIGRIARLEDRERIERLLQPFADGAHAVPVEDTEEYFREATGFHAVISLLSENRVLVLLSQTIEHIMTARITGDIDVLTQRESIEHDHVALATAILRGYARRAEELAAEHIAHLQAWYARAAPERIDEIVVWQ